MSVTINQVTFAGNLTRDPEAREVNDKAQVTGFTLANNRRYKGSDGEMKEDVTFIDCEAWGKTGEMVQNYLTKGSPVLVTGRLKLDQWQDKDGNRRSRVKIVVEQVHFLGQRATEGREELGNDLPQTSAEEDHPKTSARPRPSSRPLPRDRTPAEPPF